jgi:hypothetical protein
VSRRAQPHPVSFSLKDPNTGMRLGGLTFSAGMCKITKDGAAGVNTTNLPAAISGMPAGWYTIVLTATEKDVVELGFACDHPSAVPYDRVITTGGDASLAVVTDAGNSQTQFKSNRTETDNDYWKDCLVTFQTGAVINQVKKCTGYNGTTKIFTFASPGFTATPAAADVALIADL